MEKNQTYIASSLELHLFFARIMKEHSIVLEAGFTRKNTKLTKEANSYKLQFEKLLLDVVKLSQRRIRQCVIDSGEILTKHTLDIEKKTQYYTGIKINTKITLMEEKLEGEELYNIDTSVIKSVMQINKRAMKLVDEIICFNEKVLNEVVSCEIFTYSYALLIDQLVRESKEYKMYIEDIEKCGEINYKDIKSVELFWDQIMMEHALFVRGWLDPTEDKLINTSDKFAKDFKTLMDNTNKATEVTMANITNEALIETLKLRDFKESGAVGVIECKVKTIMLPLIADHALREANYYIRVLSNYKK